MEKFKESFKIPSMVSKVKYQGNNPYMEGSGGVQKLQAFPRSTSLRCTGFDSETIFHSGKL